MWGVHLVGTELLVTQEGGLIFQIQLAKDQQAVPLTRDHIHEWDHAAALPPAQAAE